MSELVCEGNVPDTMVHIAAFNSNDVDVHVLFRNCVWGGGG